MKFLIADDHELFLKGLELVLSNHYPDAELVLVHNYQDIFNAIKSDKNFNIILTDLAMPGDVWSNAIDKIHTQLPDTPIIILSALFDKETVQKTIGIGVSGYLSKTASHQDIIEAIDLVLSGGVYFPKGFLQTQTLKTDFVADNLLQDIQATPPKNKHLSPRQHAVLECIALGKSNKQIAYELGLTEGTVKLYVTAILKILGVYNRTAAVVEASKLGLIKRTHH